METKHLLEQTIKLKDTIETLQATFLEVKETGKEPDFFKDVRPFADETKTAAVEWQKHATSWINEIKPKYIYKQQIDSTVENIELISVQAFYPSTSRARFLNYVQSVDFVLNNVLKELNNKALL